MTPWLVVTNLASANVEGPDFTGGKVARWARTMIRFRWAVLAVWLVAVIAAGSASAGLSDLLTNRFALPGSESGGLGDADELEREISVRRACAHWAVFAQ